MVAKGAYGPGPPTLGMPTGTRARAGPVAAAADPGSRELGTRARAGPAAAPGLIVRSAALSRTPVPP